LNLSGPGGNPRTSQTTETSQTFPQGYTQRGALAFLTATNLDLLSAQRLFFFDTLVVDISPFLGEHAFRYQETGDGGARDI